MILPGGQQRGGRCPWPGGPWPGRWVPAQRGTGGGTGPQEGALDAATLSGLAAVLRSATFYSSEDVIRQGDIGDRFQKMPLPEDAGSAAAGHYARGGGVPTSGRQLIVMNKGYNGAADWWALGVLVFELCNGLPPFMGDDRLVMFRKICNREVKHLSERLLDPNPLFRADAGRTTDSPDSTGTSSRAGGGGYDYGRVGVAQPPR
ncbi:hypothetical protein PLESTF_001872000 [Pleodorina starrii]|nr:hypothetical protein PLESTF_001872000 [Pleodorina starrii]